jgi:hypothetical protein
VTAVLAKVVEFPTLVTSPVRLALVVTVSAIGAETIVMTGVVVPFATVARAFAEDTLDTVHFASKADCVAVEIGSEAIVAFLFAPPWSIGRKSAQAGVTVASAEILASGIVKKLRY